MKGAGYYFDVSRDIAIKSFNQLLSAWEYAFLGVDGLRGSSSETQFLLIRALGAGFFSDVTVVLDGLLFCYISGRTPVTHWGAESRFGDLSNDDMFRKYFFQPLSPYSIRDLVVPDFRYYPPGWNSRNLCRAPSGYRWRRKSDITPANYRQLLNLSSDVLVLKRHRRTADFVEAIDALLAADPDFAGKSLLEIYRLLAKRHLNPKSEIVEAVAKFRSECLGEKPFIGVHVRGGDKVLELNGLAGLNSRYNDLVEQEMEATGLETIFLLSDDPAIAESFRRRYGKRIVMTAAQRTASQKIQALYGEATSTNYRLGQEVMIDCLLAAQSHSFIGTSASAVSLMVGILGDFKPSELIYLTPIDGILQFDDASRHLYTAVEVSEANYRIIFT